MRSRRHSQNKRIFNLKELDIYAPNKRGMKVIVDIMDTYNISYNCELYDVTKWIEKIYSKKQQEYYGIYLTSEVINCINYIKENKLLRKEVIK